MLGEQKRAVKKNYPQLGSKAREWLTILFASYWDIISQRLFDPLGGCTYDFGLCYLVRAQILWSLQISLVEKVTPNFIIQFQVGYD